MSASLRPLAVLAVLLLFSHRLAAQEDPALLAQRRADKLASPFLAQFAWYTDLASARNAAAREGKLILVHCTRSFVPCGTSIRCEREVLASPEFETLARRVVLFCHITGHLDAESDRLLYELRGSGWPHHAVLDATGRVLGVHESYREKSVAELSGLVDRAREYLAVEAETETAIAAAARRRLEAGLATGALDLSTARSLLASCRSLTRVEADSFASAIVDLEVADVLARVDRFDESVRKGVGAEFLAMARIGKRPSGRNATRDFWGGILLLIESQEKPDVELHREGLAALEAMLGGSRGYQPFLTERREKLEAMDRAGKDR